MATQIVRRLIALSGIILVGFHISETRAEEGSQSCLNQSSFPIEAIQNWDSANSAQIPQNSRGWRISLTKSFDSCGTGPQTVETSLYGSDQQLRFSTRVHISYDRKIKLIMPGASRVVLKGHQYTPSFTDRNNHLPNFLYVSRGQENWIRCEDPDFRRHEVQSVQFRYLRNVGASYVRVTFYKGVNRNRRGGVRADHRALQSCRVEYTGTAVAVG